MNTETAPAVQTDELEIPSGLTATKDEIEAVRAKAAKANKPPVVKPPAPPKSAKPKAEVAEKPAAKEKTVKAKAKPEPKPATKVRDLRPDGLVKGSAMGVLVDTVCRKSGATNEELCEAVGWAQCMPMMRKSCERAGITLKTVKEPGQPTRYFGTPAKK